jgi:hypothetical protein
MQAEVAVFKRFFVTALDETRALLITNASIVPKMNRFLAIQMAWVVLVSDAEKQSCVLAMSIS